MLKFSCTSLWVALTAFVFGASVLLADDPPNNPNPQNSNVQTMPQQHSNVQNSNSGYGTPETNPGVANPNATTGMPGSRTLVIKSLPSKQIVGATVTDTKGERLGSIDDLVIDLESGKVVYAAVGVGGVLGVGDKLFAVPFEEFKTGHDTSNNIYFTLENVNKDRLEKAPGFDKSHWPDFASPQWRTEIDNYYHHNSAARPAGEATPIENR
jgi:sporulation protein YlmC with PRC-barrel domain